MVDEKAQSGEVLYDVEPERFLARITLNRPEKKNAIRTIDEDVISEYIRQAEEDDDVKMILISGKGDDFCSGHDLNDAYDNYGGSNDPDQRRPSQRARVIPLDHSVWGRRSFMQAIAWSKKVTICKVSGYCYGHGVPMVLYSDFVVASSDSRFSHPAVLYHGFGGDLTAYILNIGMKKAKEMTFDCKPIHAEEAERIGLVTKVVPKEKLDEEVDELIERVGRMPKDAIVMGKMHFDCAMQAVGMGTGLSIATMNLAWASNVRYEKGEFNLIRERSKSGVSNALKTRDANVKRSFVDKQD
ncbi:enoyl-CoA hydratase/isomerase family protein [Chloroflexota bacterium]